MMVISHGIGPDNIEIVVTELDALANIDFPRPSENKTGTSHSQHRAYRNFPDHYRRICTLVIS